VKCWTITRELCLLHGMRTSHSNGVAAEIRAELGRQGKNQSQLAREMDRPQQWVQRRLSGATVISAGDLLQFAEALGTSIDSFVPTSKASA
jgi:transcriptional regulator with XRE-family HTH domain